MYIVFRPKGLFLTTICDRIISPGRSRGLGFFFFGRQVFKSFLVYFEALIAVNLSQAMTLPVITECFSKYFLLPIINFVTFVFLSSLFIIHIYLFDIGVTFHDRTLAFHMLL